MTMPLWHAEARRLIGAREIPGPANSPTIMGWASRLGTRVLGAVYGADAIPWCGLYAAHCVSVAGHKPPAIALRARAWENFGTPLPLNSRPPRGAIAVFTRNGGGHVGFVDSVNADGSLNILGGNQGDAVNVRRFPRDRLTAFRWPAGVPVPGVAPIAKVVSANTTGEA